MFDVILADPGERKIQVIKIVRAHVAGLGLKEAKDLVESAPSPLLTRISRTRADGVKVELERVGAAVIVVNSA
ncbi:hypothetical protein DMP23_17595 [Amycolatopsis sp. A1MSW2902]